MSEFKKLLFIINKYSGTGYQPRLDERVMNACMDHDTECTIEYTSGPGHATDLATSGAGNFDAVIAVGGDGTVNEVARGLLSTSTPLGIVPIGSGNGLARHLNIPVKPGPALAALFHSRVIAMDTFKVNGNLSVNVSGIGFDGHIANLFGQLNKNDRGFWGYARLVFKEYFNYQEFDWELNTGAQSSAYRSFIIAIANSSQYGNNASIAPLASVTDGELNVSIAKKIPFYRGLSFAYRVFNRKLRNNDLFESMTIKEMVIKSPVPLAYHIDGEPGGYSDSFTIETFPSSLNLIIPATSQP